MRSGVTVVLIVALVFGGSAAQASMPSGCAMLGSRLLADAPLDGSGSTSSLLSIDPVDGRADRLPVSNPRSVTPVIQTGIAIVADAFGQDHLVRLADGGNTPVPGAVRTAIETTRSTTAVFRPSRWVTTTAHDAAGLQLRIIDWERDRVLVDTVFPRRIEIAATATSPDGHVVIHLQANNVASELTLFNAETGSRKELRIPHDASLAAYAISLTFSPDGSCLAVSMMRETQRPESWVIDVRRRDLTASPIGDVFVLAWLVLPWEPEPGQV